MFLEGRFYEGWVRTRFGVGESGLGIPWLVSHRPEINQFWLPHLFDLCLRFPPDAWLRACMLALHYCVEALVIFAIFQFEEAHYVAFFVGLLITWVFLYPRHFPLHPRFWTAQR
eukprot:SAG22_NODE_1059_length_5764_cov_3.282966_2_plen_114_part_00